VKGIRDFSEGDYLVDADFHRGYALLEKYSLIASLDVEWRNMAKMRDLARKFPNTVAVLDHCGFPKERTDEYFSSWRNGVTALAEADNAVCKISGLGMCDWNWTIDSIRPWVLHCIDAFGPARCIFATNWPVDRLFSTYDAVIDAYAEVISGFSQDEQVAMFSGNAEKLYGI
jgi:predicted TIM-barrel fold metal-dependent hydrolase